MPADYPTVRPLQMLDFANQAKLDSRFSFARSTPGSFVNSSGLQEMAPIDSLRPAYHPLTGQYLGLLMESPSTNLLPWSNDITAPGWYYAPQNGALSSGYIGVGGTATAYRIAEGNTLQGPGQWFIGCSFWLTGQTQFGLSAFVKSDGVNRGYLQFASFDASGVVKGNIVAYFDLSRKEVYPENYGTNALTASLEERKNGWFRVKAVGPSASGATLGIMNLVLQQNNGAAFYQGNGNGLLVDGFQVESNGDYAYVSSFIPTSGSAATRSFDTIRSASNQLNDWYVQSGATFYQETLLDNNDWYGPGNRMIFTAINANNLARVESRIRSTTSGAVLQSIVETESGATAPSTLITVGNGLQPWENPAFGVGSSRAVVVKTAYSFSPSGTTLVYNGLSSVTTSGFVPSGVSRVAIEGTDGGRMILRRATIYPLLTLAESFVLTR